MQRTPVYAHAATPLVMGHADRRGTIATPTISINSGKVDVVDTAVARRLLVAVTLGTHRQWIQSGIRCSIAGAIAFGIDGLVLSDTDHGHGYRITVWIGHTGNGQVYQLVVGRPDYRWIGCGGTAVRRQVQRRPDGGRCSSRAAA